MKSVDKEKPSEELEETSSVAAIAGHVNSEDEDEKESKIRSVVREALLIYAEKKKSLTKQKISEEKIRNFVRNYFISEAKASKEPPPASTLEGFLRSFLKAKLPSLKIEFDKLQDSDEELFGFIKIFMFGVNDLFRIPGLEQNSEEEKLNEEEEQKIKVKFGAFDDVGLEDNEEENKKEETSEPEDESAKTDFDVGARTGHKALQGMTSAIMDLKKDIIPRNLENARSTLLKNFAGWMDQWSEDNQAITDYLTKILQELNVEIPEILTTSQPEEMPAQEEVPPEEVSAEMPEEQPEENLEEEIEFD